MLNEAREEILRTLAERYPKRMQKNQLQNNTSLPEDELEKEVKYLKEKGFLDVTETTARFTARINALGIDQLEEEIIDEEVVRKILKCLEGKYPDRVGRDYLQEETGLEKSEYRKPLKYLDQKGLVEGDFGTAKINANGIDYLESP